MSQSNNFHIFHNLRLYISAKQGLYAKIELGGIVGVQGKISETQREP
jgi:hypothetical protein